MLDFETEMLLSAEEMAAVQEKGFDHLKYIDPVLEHDPHSCHVTFIVVDWSGTPPNLGFRLAFSP